MYKVIAYDTDYGFKASWDFTSLEAAERWCWALTFDYGEECQAHIIEE